MDAVLVHVESDGVVPLAQGLSHQLGPRGQREPKIVAIVAARDARERGCGRTGIRREDADDEPAHALIRIVAEQRREEGPRVRPVR